MKNKNIIITVLLVIIFGAGGFFSGMKYQQGQKSQLARQFGNQPGARNGQGQFRGGRAVTGSIISSDDTSITVKLADGSSKIVLVSDKTTINKAAQAALSDLKTGETVAVFGQDNADGSVTAQNIQLNPINRGPINGGKTGARTQ